MLQWSSATPPSPLPAVASSACSATPSYGESEKVMESLYKRNIKRKPTIQIHQNICMYMYICIYICKNHMHVCHTNCCWLPPIQKMLFLGGEWPQTSQKCLKPSTTTATAANWCSCNLCIMLLKLSQRKWSHFQEKVDKALEERLVLYQFLFAGPSRLKNLQTHDVMWILVWSCLQVP